MLLFGVTGFSFFALGFLIGLVLLYRWINGLAIGNTLILVVLLAVIGIQLIALGFISEFLALTESDEGYLFPDSYLFPREVTAQKVVDRLRSTFEEKYTLEVAPKASKNFTKTEIVIMASILERETKGVAERPTVSGILWKRIANDWPLQVDASVQYAISSQQPIAKGKQLKEWWPVLTLDDLNISSPYNTYRYKGLPPAPISNPGIVSLKSAANPEESEYWFYIHSPDSKIHYAKTAEEHAENVRRYLGK